MAGELDLKTTLNKPNLPVTTTQQLAYVLIEVDAGYSPWRSL